MAKKVTYRVDGGCVLCMTCIYQCPVQAITIQEDVSAVIDEEKCIRCGRCANSCQPSAIIKVETE